MYFLKYITEETLEPKIIIIEKEIGRGSFGAVYKATLDGYGQIALKKIIYNKGNIQSAAEELELASLDLKYSIIPKKILLKEYESSINHEFTGIITEESTDLGLPEGEDANQYDLPDTKKFYIIYDLADGIDLLTDIFNHTNLRIKYSLSVLIKYISDMLNGIKELFDNNIVHRDIKPDNMVIHRGSLKYIDFGFACYIDKCDKQIKGTNAYMSPDIIKRGFDFKKGDIFSIGVSIILLITKVFLYEEALGIEDEEIKITVSRMPDVLLQDYITDFIQKHCYPIFRELLIGMTQVDPEKRWDIDKCIQEFKKVIPK